MGTLLFLYVTFGIGYVILSHTLDKELRDFVEPNEPNFWITITILLVIWPVSFYIRYGRSRLFWNDVQTFFKEIGKNGKR